MNGSLKMNKHTKEPWSTYSFWYPLYADKQTITIVNSRGNSIATLAYKDDQENIENAHRIVSCVNACTGTNPEAIPELLEFLKRLCFVESSEAIKGTAKRLLEKLNFKK